MEKLLRHQKDLEVNLANIRASSYIHRMLDERMDFRQFVWNCVRYTGVDIEKVCESSDYHMNAKTKAEEKLDELLSIDDRKAFGLKERSKLIEYYQCEMDEIYTEYEQIDSMIKKVKEWNPPTPNHDKLKSFMLEQLDLSSCKDIIDFYRNSIINAKKKGGYEYWADAVKKTRDDIDFHTKQYDEENRYCNEWQTWIQSLVDSVGQP